MCTWKTGVSFHVVFRFHDPYHTASTLFQLDFFTPHYFTHDTRRSNSVTLTVHCMFTVRLKLMGSLWCGVISSFLLLWVMLWKPCRCLQCTGTHSSLACLKQNCRVLTHGHFSTLCSFRTRHSLRSGGCSNIGFDQHRVLVIIFRSPNHCPPSSMPPPSSSFFSWASNLVLIWWTYLIISFHSESARGSVVSNSLRLHGL